MLADTLKPIETARGLPSNLYTDHNATISERESVFFNNWAALTQGVNVPEKGSVMPIDFLDMPLLIVRGTNEQIKVFQNVCRHRGTKLVTEAGKIKGPITCPYHAWAYDLNGALKATPHVGGADIHTHENIKPEEMGLLEVRSHVWRDVIFVNVNENAPDFEEANKEIINRWQEFDQPMYHGGKDSGFSLVLDTNWKLAIDNYCESYHLPFVHPELNTYSRLEDHYNIVGQDNFAGQGTLVYNPSLSNDGRTFPNFTGLAAKWDKAAEYIALFPNLLLGVHRDHAYSIIIEPQATDKTAEHIEIYYPTKDCTTAEYAQLRKNNAKLWKTVFTEDIGVVEAMQQGRKAPGYDGGRFSPVMEEATYKFHHWIAENLQKNQDAAPQGD